MMDGEAVEASRYPSLSQGLREEDMLIKRDKERESMA